MFPETRYRAFTLIEALAVVVVALAAFLFLMLTMSRPHHGHGGRQIKDSTQVRGVHQGLVMFAQNNQDRYPLPSLIDKGDGTLTGDPAAKDTTSNIISLLIWNGYFGPELCVSPAETNGNIRQMSDYAYTAPAGAANAAKALFDPAFNADFTASKPGHFSYGHGLPSGAHLEDWKLTWDPSTAIVGNRGPQVTAAVKRKAPDVSIATALTNSNTLLIHGARTTWEGNIAYNDNHVNFETRMDPDGLTYKDVAGTKWSDCLFFDEPDDVKGRNNFLGIFNKAGATPADFHAIWD